jgi:sulfatase modifying factor 1
MKPRRTDAVRAALLLALFTCASACHSNGPGKPTPAGADTSTPGAAMSASAAVSAPRGPDSTAGLTLDASVDALDDGAVEAAMGGTAKDAGSGAACPEGMSDLGRYCADRWEAYLVSRGADGGEVIHPYFERPAEGTAYEARTRAGQYPQGYISRVEAAAACRNAGKRLCTRAEWMRACQGRRGWTYPYGNRRRAGACNQGKIHLLSKMFGSNGREWKYDEHFNNPLLNQEPGFLARSGEYDGCTGDAGTWDMVGNLHEWVSDTVTEELVEKLENDGVERRKQPWRVGNGIFMGGFFSTSSEHGPGCKFTTIAHEPTYHDYSIGFRCCVSLPAKGK